MNNLRRQENGQMAILMVMVLPAVFLILALPLDAGIWFLDHRIAQNQADAAVLAAVQYLPDADTTLATAAANTWLVKNGSGPAELDCLVYTDSYPESLPDGEFDAIEVCVRRQSPGVFSGLAGLDFIYVGASATAAVVYEAAAVDASFMALNPTACNAFDLSANSSFLSEGPIMVNSECSNYAASIGCNSDCEAQGGIGSVGGVDADGNCDPCPVTAVPHFADPMQYLLPPCFPSSPLPCEDVGPLIVRHGTPANPELFVTSSSLQPGIYYGGLEINDDSMAPGIYIMAGGGFNLNSNNAYAAPGVFIYNTNDPACPACTDGGFGPVVINSNNSADLTPMTTATYAGLLFFQDRANTLPAVFTPNSDFGEGTVYFSSAHVDFNPNSTATIRIIADTIEINSNSELTARFDGDSFVQVPTARMALTG